MATAAAEKLDAAPSARTPPYVAYKTFLTLLEDLKSNSLPPQIDRSVLKRFSGGVGSQLLMALKSLGLVNEHNHPTANLNAMVKALGTPADFNPIMKDALRFGFPFLNGLDLTTATPAMFADAFKVTGAKEDVLKKCRRFYLQAAREIGIQLGPRLASSPSPGPRATAQPSAARDASPRQPRAPREKAKRKQTHVSDHHYVPQSMQSQLVGKYPDFDPAWPDEIKAAWFEGFQKLMATATEK